MYSGHFPLLNRNVVITGGSQGLGAELGRQAVLQGAASVTLIARTEKKLQEVVKTIEALKIREDQLVTYVAADVSSYEECDKAVASLRSPPDVVFLCAGSSLPKLLLDLTPKELEQGVSVNYSTALYFSHAAFKVMSQQTTAYRRHIVFCSSVLAVFPFIGYGHYAPVKAAIRALSDVLRHEAIPYNIGVECVYPGNFASEGFVQEEKTKPTITKEIEGPSAAIPVEKCAQVILWWLDHGYESVYTDAIGWLLSCGMLGMSPRVGGLFQVFIAMLLAIIAPVYMWITHRDIRNYFNKKKNE